MGDVAIILTNNSKQFRWTASRLLKSLKASVRPMRLKGRREAHNAEVVERALFATRKSLKCFMSGAQFPIARAAPPRTPSRDFVHWTFSYAGRRSSRHYSCAAGIRKRSQ